MAEDFGTRDNDVSEESIDKLESTVEEQVDSQENLAVLLEETSNELSLNTEASEQTAAKLDVVSDSLDSLTDAQRKAIESLTKLAEKLQSSASSQARSAGYSNLQDYSEDRRLRSESLKFLQQPQQTALGSVFIKGFDSLSSLGDSLKNALKPSSFLDLLKKAGIVVGGISLLGHAMNFMADTPQGQALSSSLGIAGGFLKDIVSRGVGLLRSGIKWVMSGFSDFWSRHASTVLSFIKDQAHWVADVVLKPLLSAAAQLAGAVASGIVDWLKANPDALADVLKIGGLALAASFVAHLPALLAGANLLGGLAKLLTGKAATTAVTTAGTVGSSLLPTIASVLGTAALSSFIDSKITGARSDATNAAKASPEFQAGLQAPSPKTQELANDLSKNPAKDSVESVLAPMAKYIAPVLSILGGAGLIAAGGALSGTGIGAIGGVPMALLGKSLAFGGLATGLGMAGVDILNKSYTKSAQAVNERNLVQSIQDDGSARVREQRLQLMKDRMGADFYSSKAVPDVWQTDMKRKGLEEGSPEWNSYLDAKYADWTSGKSKFAPVATEFTKSLGIDSVSSYGGSQEAVATSILSTPEPEQAAKVDQASQSSLSIGSMLSSFMKGDWLDAIKLPDLGDASGKVTPDSVGSAVDSLLAQLGMSGQSQVSVNALDRDTALYDPESAINQDISRNILIGGDKTQASSTVNQTIIYPPSTFSDLISTVKGG